MTPMTEHANVERLIRRQMSLWDVRDRLGREGGAAAERELAHLAQGPWITISKQLGSGWRRLAARLGEDLGWQIFDREIVEAIAREPKTRDRILARLDEHAVGGFDEFFSRLIAPEQPGQTDYLYEMTRVIWAVARQGHAILLGRGANWLLDPRYGLRVRTIAPEQHRIVMLAETEGLTRAAAAKRIHEDDTERAAFIRQVYRRDIDDPFGYDLILNTAGLPLEAAVKAVTAALRAKLGARE